MSRAAALAFLLVLATAACSRSSSTDRGKPTSSSSAADHTRFTINVTGQPFGLRVEGGTVSYCDARGGRKLDAKTGQDAASPRTCAKDEPNTGCGELPLDVQVSNPSLGPNDRVEVSGSAYPLEGHVRDCAVHGKVIAAITGQVVVLINTANDHVDVLDHQGGERVAIGPEWIVWSSDSTIEMRKR